MRPRGSSSISAASAAHGPSGHEHKRLTSRVFATSLAARMASQRITGPCRPCHYQPGGGQEKLSLATTRPGLPKGVRQMSGPGADLDERAKRQKRPDEQAIRSDITLGLKALGQRH
jgi:hypothetical protein